MYWELRLWIANRARYEESRDMNEFSYAFGVSNDTESIRTGLFPFKVILVVALSGTSNYNDFFSKWWKRNNILVKLSTLFV